MMSWAVSPGSAPIARSAPPTSSSGEPHSVRPWSGESRMARSPARRRYSSASKALATHVAWHAWNVSGQARLETVPEHPPAVGAGCGHTGEVADQTDIVEAL